MQYVKHFKTAQISYGVSKVCLLVDNNTVIIVRKLFVSGFILFSCFIKNDKDIKL